MVAEVAVPAATSVATPCVFARSRVVVVLGGVNIVVAAIVGAVVAAVLHVVEHSVDRGD